MRIKKPIVSLVVLVAAGITAAAAWAAVPTNTTPPTVTGTPQKGMTLTAQHGAWAGTPTAYAYKWQRCAADGTSCANIISANAKTYTLTSADVGRTLRVRVTASNADGRAAAVSAPTDVVSASGGPKLSTRPTISGTPQPGEELTASNGTWTGAATSFTYQWQRCDTTGAGCVDVPGATGRTYGVRAADVGHTLRVAVTAKNSTGSTTATSDVSATVRTTATPSPTPAPSANRRPTIRILGVHFAGTRVFVRFRTCDDSLRNLHFLERDSRPGVAGYVRSFRTLIVPRPCATLSRSWLPAPRFRHGRFTISLRARDAHGAWSLRPATRSIFRA